MPLYEYKCDKCGKVFEVIQRFSDEPLSAHADCGGVVERLISTSALHFKGSGFYITDYAKGSKTAPAASGGSDAKAEGKSEGKSDSKADSKPETKPASKSDSSAAPATPVTAAPADSSKK